MRINRTISTSLVGYGGAIVGMAGAAVIGAELHEYMIHLHWSKRKTTLAAGVMAITGMGICGVALR